MKFEFKGAITKKTLMLYIINYIVYIIIAIYLLHLGTYYEVLVVVTSIQLIISIVILFIKYKINKKYRNYLLITSNFIEYKYKKNHIKINKFEIESVTDIYDLKRYKYYSKRLILVNKIDEQLQIKIKRHMMKDKLSEIIKWLKLNGYKVRKENIKKEDASKII